MTESTNDIDTSNQFMVGMRGNIISSLILRREFTTEEALNLSSYLVVLADHDGRFAKVLAAVENT